MIQGLVVLFVGAELLILSIWNARKKLRAPARRLKRRERRHRSRAPTAAVGDMGDVGIVGIGLGISRSGSRFRLSPFGRCGFPWSSARWPPPRCRRADPRRATHRLGGRGEWRNRDRGRRRSHAGEHPAPGRCGALVDPRVGFVVADHGADLRRDRRPVFGAKRGREHRAGGDDADGRVLRRLGRRPPARG